MNFIILREIVLNNTNVLSQEDYDGFMGLADDAEDSSRIDDCIGDYLNTLAAEQGVPVNCISLANADCNDLLYLVMGE